MTNPFPYNQIVAAYSPTTGPFSGYSFAAATWANGVTMAEFQRHATGSAGSYTSQCVPGMDANGASNTCLTFLLDRANTGEVPPYYFIGGSTANHIILYSFTPTAAAQSLGSGCIRQVATVATLGAAVAAFSFDPTTGTLFVADAGGGLHVYFVKFDPATGIPGFTLVRTKTGFAADGQGQIQIRSVVLEEARPHGFVTGLTEGGKQGIVRMNAVLEAEVMPGTPAGSVAMVPIKHGIYVVTATGIEVRCAGGLEAGEGVAWSTAWKAPAGVTLTCASYCSMTGVSAFPQGVLLIGGYGGAASNSANCGLIYLHDLAAGTTSLLVGGVSGPVYGLVADQAVYALYANGSNGFGVLNLTAGSALNTVLVVNTPKWEQKSTFLQEAPLPLKFVGVSVAILGISVVNSVWAVVGLAMEQAAEEPEFIGMEELGEILARNDSWRNEAGSDFGNMDDLENLPEPDHLGEGAGVENLDYMDGVGVLF